MSIQAMLWAWEQRCGMPDPETGEFSTNHGAKSVLVAHANYADEDGKSWAGQDTIAAMCDMGERTVRRHLAYLEDERKLIRREERRRSSGERTSDYVYLLAPPERLRTSVNKQPAKLTGNNRPTTTAQPAKLTGEPLEEPSDSPNGDTQPAEGADVLPVNKYMTLLIDGLDRVQAAYDPQDDKRKFVGGLRNCIRKDATHAEMLAVIDRIVERRSDQSPYPLFPVGALTDIREGKVPKTTAAAGVGYRKVGANRYAKVDGIEGRLYADIDGKMRKVKIDDHGAEYVVSHGKRMLI